MITKYVLIFLFLVCSVSTYGQETLTISRQEAEALFLKENLLLMAERLEIPKAEALVLQTRLWPNPTLSIDDVNLWATPSQKEPYGEELPPLFGNFGKYQQFGIGLEQLITTAGKRKKLIGIEQVTADKASIYFEELLRNLKVEFRKQLTQLQYLQLKEEIYGNQIQALGHLVRSHQNQVDQGHIPKGDYIRLKALELEFLKHSNDLKIAINEVEKELKLLLNLPADTSLVLSEAGFSYSMGELSESTLGIIMEKAKTSRPDLHLAELDIKQSDMLYAYERAKRIPDITLKAGYERGGNILYNFIGFGLDIDLPIFNRNQGNIKAAQIDRERSKLMLDHKSQLVDNEITLAYRNLLTALAFYKGIEPEYESTLEQLLYSYTKNFTDRNIGLLEYIDFLDAYLENKNIILEAGKEVHEKAEELNYAIGQDIIQ